MIIYLNKENKKINKIKLHLNLTLYKELETD